MSLCMRWSEAEIRRRNLIPKDESQVMALYKRGFHSYLNELLFAGFEIVFSTLLHLNFNQIKRHRLYGMIFSSRGHRPLTDDQYIALVQEFVKTDYPFQRVPYKIICRETLLELSLSNANLARWLEVQEIRLPTVEDIRFNRNIPSSSILRDAVNDSLYDQGQYNFMLFRSTIESQEFYIRRGILPTTFDYLHRLDFITAYEKTQNDDFIIRNISHFCNLFTFRMFFTRSQFCRLFKLLAPHLHLMEENLREAVQHPSRPNQFIFIVGNNVNWSTIRDNTAYTSDFLEACRSPLAYKRYKKDLTPSLLLSYLREGFPVDYEFLKNQHYRHLLQDQRIQNLLTFPQRETWQPYHFFAMDNEKRNLVHHLALIHSVEGNVLHLLPPELLFLVIDFLIV